MKQASKRKLNIPILIAIVFTVVVIALVALVGVYVCKTESSTPAAGSDSGDQAGAAGTLSGNLSAALNKISNAKEKKRNLFEAALRSPISFAPNAGLHAIASDAWPIKGVLGGNTRLSGCRKKWQYCIS